MNKPEKRAEDELIENFVGYLFDTYEPRKNSAGEYYSTSLDYLTNESSYMNSKAERKFVEDHGLSPIAFLELLRVEMAKTSGFGICITDKELQNSIYRISLVYELKLAELQQYYEQLVDAHLILVINDHDGNQYATTLQQIFNGNIKCGQDGQTTSMPKNIVKKSTIRKRR